MTARRLNSAAMYERLSDDIRASVLIAVLAAACLSVAVFDGFWPGAVAAAFDAFVLTARARDFVAGVYLAAEIIVTREHLAREAGRIAST